MISRMTNIHYVPYSNMFVTTMQITLWCYPIAIYTVIDLLQYNNNSFICMEIKIPVNQSVNQSILWLPSITLYNGRINLKVFGYFIPFF